MGEDWRILVGGCGGACYCNDCECFLKVIFITEVRIALKCTCHEISRTDSNENNCTMLTT